MQKAGKKPAKGIAAKKQEKIKKDCREKERYRRNGAGGESHSYENTVKGKGKA